jgi:enamine deaminase RidA (YjgF/YER057c/UK114 family)
VTGGTCEIGRSTDSALSCDCEAWKANRDPKTGGTLMTETEHQIVTAPELAPPVGYAHAVAAAPGTTVYLGGQTALNAANEIEGETLVEQFDLVAANVMTALKAAGGRAEDIVSMQIFVCDIDDYKAHLRELAVAWKRNFGNHYPAAGLFGVTRLFDEPALVELMAVAVIPEGRG